MSDRSYTVRDFADGVADLAKGVKVLERWLALVAAIAVGTCAGLALFVWLVYARVAHEGPFTSPTETPTTSETSQP